MRGHRVRRAATILAGAAIIVASALSSVLAAPTARVQSYGSCAFSGDPSTWWPAGGTASATGNFRYRCPIAINDRGDVAYATDVAAGGSSYRHAMLSSKGRLTDIGAIISTQLSATDVDSLVRDVNASGTVVGLFRQRSTGAQQRAFLWQPGATEVTELTLVVDGSTALSPDPRAINNAGDVVFISSFAGPSLFEYHAFVRWADGTTARLPDAGTASPGGPAVMPADINGAGLVAGSYFSLDGSAYRTNAFVWRSGDTTLTRLAPPEGFVEAWGEGTNASGQVVGMAFTPGGPTGPQAVQWAGDGAGTLLPWTVDPTSGQYNGYSEATAISDRGVVVGLADNVAGTYLSSMQAISWSRGRLTVLASPAGDMSAATGVNRGGQVVGVAAPSDDPSASPLESLLWR